MENQDFLWKISLKILNSGIILKTFIHTYRHATFISQYIYIYSLLLDTSKFQGTEQNVSSYQ